MADNDENGELSWAEIQHLCKNNLAKFIGDKDAKFLDLLYRFAPQYAADFISKKMAELRKV